MGGKSELTAPPSSSITHSGSHLPQLHYAHVDVTGAQSVNNLHTASRGAGLFDVLATSQVIKTSRERS